jgi:hypothetical protein
LFLVQEGQRALLTSIDEVRDAPVSLAIAAPQIAQYLANRKSKELAQAEIQRLRATARIDYLNKDLAPDAATPGALPAAAPASLAGAGLEMGSTANDGNGDNDIGPVDDTVGEDARADKAALERGVAGLK